MSKLQAIEKLDILITFFKEFNNMLEITLKI
jgi:hypothetical protein